MPDSGAPDGFHAQLAEWRHGLHRRPELGFEEHRTAGFVAEKLTEFGLAVHTGIGGTGVVGVLRLGDGEGMIGLRADMDALAIQEENNFDYASEIPGKMHACGHDGHTTILLGAARRLAEEGGFDGTAIFIFQPAEEHGCGAKAMIEDGLFERFPVDAVYGLHNMPSLPTGQVAVRSGPIMACEDNFEIRITGKGGHAAAPHRSIDPIVIGSETVLALQSIISRNLDPLDSGVISVTDFNVDATRNVIPETVRLRGDTRAYTPEMQEFIETSMRRISRHIALAHGAEAEMDYTHEFSATINSEVETAVIADVATRVLGAEKVQANCAPVMASEDFGTMLEHKPGCYFFLGNGGDGPGGCGLHSPHYDFNDDILSTGVTLWVELIRTALPVRG